MPIRRWQECQGNQSDHVPNQDARTLQTDGSVAAPETGEPTLREVRQRLCCTPNVVNLRKKNFNKEHLTIGRIFEDSL